MKHTRISSSVVVLALVSALVLGLPTYGQAPTPEAPIGTELTYQGRLSDGAGHPIDDVCDFRFRLYDDDDTGNQVGPDLTPDDVSVSDGYFTVLLDFGGAFDGTMLWLEVAVWCTGDLDYVPLTPRQKLTAAPNALYARLADSANTASWAGDADTVDGVHAEALVTVDRFEAADMENLAANASFEFFRAGSNTYPDRWILLGDAYWANSVGRVEPGVEGAYAVRVEDASTVRHCIQQQVYPTGELPQRFRGQPLVLSAWASKVPNSGTATGEIAIDDGVARSAASLQDTETWHSAVVVHTVAATATGLAVELCPAIAPAQVAAYDFDAVMLTVGTFAPPFRPGLLDRLAVESVAVEGLLVEGPAEITGDLTLGGMLNGGTPWTSANDGPGSGLDADTVDGLHGGGLWALAGNAGTVPGTDFLGTTDAQALELKVNGARALRLEPAILGYPNVLLGAGDGVVTAGVYGAAIGGGLGNRVTDSLGTVGGGGNNRAGDDDGYPTDASAATVGGGSSNIAGDAWATVGGGYHNSAGNRYATAGGGDHNAASGAWATAGGGDHNTASGNYAAIGGGSTNSASAAMAAVGGGKANRVTDLYGTVGGGWDNQAGNNNGVPEDSPSATVAGGQTNTASGQYATVSGGYYNTASGPYAFVGGGNGNVASGFSAMIPGGQGNAAQGTYSFAGGFRARANHDGSFVWSDSALDEDFASTANDQFLVRATGGVSFTTGGASLRINGNTAWHGGNDGDGSGLDADLLDGQHASAFATSGHNHWGATWSGSGTGLTLLNGDIGLDGSGSTYGVAGRSTSGTGYGVYGSNTAGGNAIYGVTTSGASYAAIKGINNSFGAGVYGSSTSGDGVYGSGSSGVTGSGNIGVTGSGSIGVYGYSTGGGDHVWGVYGSSDNIGGQFVSSSSTNPGLYAQNTGGGDIIQGWDSSAKKFRVSSTGEVYADSGYNCGNSIGDSAGELDETEISPCLQDDIPADFAEMMPAANALEPGDLLVVGADGRLARSSQPYQASVVGVYSTRPSYVGNSRYWGQAGYAPLALSGVVPVKASAENGPIQPGDMLTASSIAGHAMRCVGVEQCFGRTVGKALAGLERGTGVILMVVTLQ